MSSKGSGGILDLTTVNRAPLHMDFLCSAEADATGPTLVGVLTRAAMQHGAWISHQDSHQEQHKAGFLSVFFCMNVKEAAH